jgi:DNA-binding transcriptional ArsR family regulator
MSNLPPETAARLADRFRTLGDPMRLRLLYALTGGERRVGDLVDSTGGLQANVSKHLQLLYQQGLVARRKDGTAILYRIADPVVFQLCDLVCGSLGLPSLHPRRRRTAAAR